MFQTVRALGETHAGGVRNSHKCGCWIRAPWSPVEGGHLGAHQKNWPDESAAQR